jgi:hypothetical protein
MKDLSWQLSLLIAHETVAWMKEHMVWGSKCTAHEHVEHQCGRAQLSNYMM